MITSKLKITLLLSYICIASISAAIITPALPHIETVFMLSDGALEWVISIFLIGYVVGQLIYGPVAKRYGSLKALRAGLLVNLVGIFVCIVASAMTNFPLLLVGRLVTALGAASGLACTFMLIHECLAPDTAKHALSFTTVSFTLGVGIAIFAGGFITQYLHWQDCFWLLALHGIVMFAGTWAFPDKASVQHTINLRTLFSGYLQALRSTKLIVYSLMLGLLSVFTYCYSAAAPIYAHDVLHLSPSQYGSWNLLNTIGMLCSGFVSVVLMKRYGPKRLLFIGCGMIVPALVSLQILSVAQQSTALWFFLTSSALYLFTGMVFPAASLIASKSIDCPQNASSMMSFINMGTAMLCVIIAGYLPFSPIESFTIVFSIFFLLAMTLVLFRRA